MTPIDLLEAARDVQEFCDGHGWRWCFIGGLAVLRWGESRVTRDIDLTLLTGYGDERGFIDVLLGRYEPRLVDSGPFALRSRVLLLKTGDGIGIDVSLGALPFERVAIARATDFEFSPGLRLRTCSAEDLLVMKLFASRPIDLRDAEGVAVRNQEWLDWGYVEEKLTPLAEAKGEAEIMRQFARIRQTSELL
jgi:hypothetical protein